MRELAIQPCMSVSLAAPDRAVELRRERPGRRGAVRRRDDELRAVSSWAIVGPRSRPPRSSGHPATRRACRPGPRARGPRLGSGVLGVDVDRPDRGPRQEVRVRPLVGGEGDGPPVGRPGELRDAPVARRDLAGRGAARRLDDVQVGPPIERALLVPLPVEASDPASRRRVVALRLRPDEEPRRIDLDGQREPGSVRRPGDLADRAVPRRANGPRRAGRGSVRGERQHAEAGDLVLAILARCRGGVGRASGRGTAGRPRPSRPARVAATCPGPGRSSAGSASRGPRAGRATGGSGTDRPRRGAGRPPRTARRPTCRARRARPGRG